MAVAVRHMWAIFVWTVLISVHARLVFRDINYTKTEDAVQTLWIVDAPAVMIKVAYVFLA